MERIVKQNYSYAVDASGVLVNVKQAVRDKKYFCPCCGFEMRPHMGNIRRWHFTHKAEAECSYESYLHKIAKIRIKEAFITSEKFAITYNPKHLCSKDCPFLYDEKCFKHKYVTFNLKEYYDECEEELECDGFVPDLILRSSSAPNREPVFLEIYVTHKSTEEKLKSGYRIIEIPITSEEDIYNIVETMSLKGEDSSVKQDEYSKTENIRFYNFNKKYYLNDMGSIVEPKYILIVNKDGTFKYEKVVCYEFNEKFNSPEQNLIISNFPINWNWAFLELQKRGVNITNCLRCKFYKRTMFRDRICTLYKKYGTPKSPKISEARKCSRYTISDKTEEGFPISSLTPGYNHSEDCGGRKPFVNFVLRWK